MKSNLVFHFFTNQREEEKVRPSILILHFCIFFSVKVGVVNVQRCKRATNTIQSHIALYNEYYYGYGKPMSNADDVVGPHVEIPFVLKYKVYQPKYIYCTSIKCSIQNFKQTI